ncbi:ImmA/IrrE family metallo-endopeptidase [Moorella naiadis]|uniref:ImmA/IrrE family metallo-endopeptidase n=1 Tax=Moorella naiadis (nom. illeg.) TaxID=3093670 RepID=UPI003D9C9E86
MAANKSKARLAARRTLSEAGVSSFPVNPYSIIKNYRDDMVNKINIVFFEGIPIDGWTGITETGLAAIFINKERNYVKNRWTAAHELAHIVLGHPLYSLEEFDIQRDPDYEREADVFTEELLIPSFMVKECIVQRKIKSLLQMALDFRVSREAMSIRLKNILIPSAYRQLHLSIFPHYDFTDIIDIRESVPVKCPECGSSLYPTADTYSLVCACGLELHFVDGNFIDELFGP